MWILGAYYLQEPGTYNSLFFFPFHCEFSLVRSNWEPPLVERPLGSGARGEPRVKGYRWGGGGEERCEFGCKLADYRSRRRRPKVNKC